MRASCGVVGGLKTGGMSGAAFDGEGSGVSRVTALANPAWPESGLMYTDHAGAGDEVAGICRIGLVKGRTIEGEDVRRGRREHGDGPPHGKGAGMRLTKGSPGEARAPSGSLPMTAHRRTASPERTARGGLYMSQVPLEADPESPRRSSASRTSGAE